MSTTLSIVTATKAGAAISATASVVSADVVTVSCNTAQSIIDLRKFMLRIAATSALSISLAAGGEYSETGQGALAISVATATSAIWGGQDVESARYVNSSGNLVFTISAGTGTFEAFQLPNARE